MSEVSEKPSPFRSSRIARAVAVLCVGGSLAASGLAAVAPLRAQDKAGAKDAIAPPSRLWAAQTAKGYVTLVWDTVPGATEYRVYRRSCSSPVSCVFKMIGRVAKTVVRIVDAFLPFLESIAGLEVVGAVLEYAIVAVGPLGALSDTAKFNPVKIAEAKSLVTAPAPASVTATETAPGEITVTWAAVPGATAYAIGRAVAPDGFRMRCALCPTETKFVDRAVTAGAKTAYSVSAITPEGAGRRGISNEVTPTVGSKDATVATGDSTLLSPKAASGVKAAFISSNAVSVTWTPAFGAKGYQIQRRVGGGRWAVIGRVVAEQVSTAMTFVDRMLDQTLSAMGLVQYAVVAESEKGLAEPALSNTLDPKAAVTTATQSDTTAPPKSATGVTATLTSPTAVTITWLPSPLATGYRILRKIGDQFVQIASLVPGLAPVLTYVDNIGSLLDKAALVQYAVVAENAKGAAAPATSNVIDLKAALTAPVAYSTSATSVTLAWPAVTGATGYRITRSLNGGAYAALVSLGSDVTRYVDTTPNLMAQKPRYQLLALNPKGSAAPVSFAGPSP